MVGKVVTYTPGNLETFLLPGEGLITQPPSQVGKSSGHHIGTPVGKYRLIGTHIRLVIGVDFPPSYLVSYVFYHIGVDFGLGIWR